MVPVAGTGFLQLSRTLLAGVWQRVVAGNNNRMFLTLQNTGANPVYLYQGETAPAAVDGSVGFKCLRGGSTPYDEFVSGDDECVFRGDIWALAVGVGGSTLRVGEW